MSFTALKNHGERIRRIKFFCDKHEQIQQAYDGIRSSIWTDNEKDQELFTCMNKVVMLIEAKMLEKIK